MFKQQNSFWLYFFGLIVMFVALFFVFQAMAQRTSPNRQPLVNVTIKATTPMPTPKITKKVGTTSVVKPSSTKVASTKSVIATIAGQLLDLKKDYTAEIVTNYGSINLDLYERSAPNTVTNFINLANSKYYDGTKFFKLIPGVILQGGSDKTKNTDPADDAYGTPGFTIPDENNWDSLDYSNELRRILSQDGYRSSLKIASKDIEKYSIVTANPRPNSAGSQFVIILTDVNNPIISNLRGRVTVFAKILPDSQAVIDKLSVLPVDNNENSPRPLDDVIIKEVKIYSK
jgi:cyclophilin family peptidyl-prolyl cis-trans isomerase